MEEHLIPYFAAEKQEALIFMLVGTAALAVAAWLFKAGGAYRGMLYPLAAIALIQLTVGGTVYFRTDSQVAALKAQYQAAPAAFQLEEAARMDKVAKNFVVYRWIEIGLLVTGVLLIVGLRRNELWHAVGIGLALQSALMLTLDYFAEKRAHEYLDFVTAVSAGAPS
jgi:hypothetical protein